MERSFASAELRREVQMLKRKRAFFLVLNQWKTTAESLHHYCRSPIYTLLIYFDINEALLSIILLS